jgi:small subunit ribosomal protein S5
LTEEDINITAELKSLQKEPEKEDYNFKIMPIRRERPKRIFEKKQEEFESKLLDLARVTRVTAGGRRFRFRAGVVIGDKKGRVGFGVAKGKDVAQAVEKATRVAKKNLITVPTTEETILHPVEAKFGAARVILKPQRKGRGLVAGGTVRVICTLAGIKNISSKIVGKTGNKINNAKATILALSKLKSS